MRLLKISGHTIGIHGFLHQSLIYKSKQFVFAQLCRNKHIVEKIIGDSVLYFRPPFGKFSPAIIKSCNLLNVKIVMWNFMSYDFDLNVSDNYILNKIKLYVRGGDVIVFHDGHKNSYRTVQLLTPVIKLLKAKRFEFSSL